MVKINQLYHSKYFWLFLSLVYCSYYGIISCYYALSHNYIVQDDARQHVVWLEKFSNPQLFNNDLIADYYLSLAPLGYKGLYWLVAKLGCQPLIFAKILPLILGLIASLYIFLFSFKILPLPFSAFLCTLFFNQLIWNEDDLISATPRAFIYPLFALFLYYFTRQKFLPTLIIIFLQALFYPPFILVNNTILFFNLFDFNWHKKTPITLSKNLQKYLLFILGVLTLLSIIIIQQKLQTLKLETINLAQMKITPEFGVHGRNQYFIVGHPLYFWFKGRSGINLPFFPYIVFFSITLPFFLQLKQLKIVKLITEKITILNLIIISSFTLFFLAHIFLPKFYLPSRYTYHSLRFVISISLGIIVTIICDLLRIWWKKRKKISPIQLKDKIMMSLLSILAILIITVPLIPKIFLIDYQSWRIGETSEIYRFLASQPENILVASLSKEINNIPAFTQRSILVGEEFALAYHPEYHHQIKQRTIDLLQAQYTENLNNLKSFINKYNINYIMLDSDSFSPNYLLEKNWLIYSSWQTETYQIINQLKKGNQPVIKDLIKPCQIISTEKLILIDTKCILTKTVN